MPIDFPIDPTLLGLRISGDVAGCTIYQTKAGKTVIYPASPAKEPATPAQIVQRNRFRQVAANWHAMSTDTHVAFEAVTQTLSLMMTGYDLWTYLSLSHDSQFCALLVEQSQINLSMPPPV